MTSFEIKLRRNDQCFKNINCDYHTGVISYSNLDCVFYAAKIDLPVLSLINVSKNTYILKYVYDCVCCIIFSREYVLFKLLLEHM